jgi:hypothetical protein
MPAYTGNAGTIYIAPFAENGALALNSNFAVSNAVVYGSTISAGTRVEAVAVTGNGSGAKGLLYGNYSGTTGWSGNIAASSSVRSGNIRITDGGANYTAGDTIYWRILSNSRKITNDVTVSSAITAGIDNETDLRVAAQKIARVRSWSFSIANDVVERTTLGDSSRTYIATPGTATGSASLLYYRDDNESDSLNLDIPELRNILFTSSARRVLMSLGITSSASDDFVFRAFITGASVSANYGEVVAVDVNFQMDGPLISSPT